MRVALFGHGHMGRLHARHLAGHDVVVIDPPQGLEGDLAGIDAAIVASPTVTHTAVALPLLERGVPCLVEKPLAATLEEARRLAAFPHLSVGHVERFNPTLDALQGVVPRFVQAERVGRWTPRGTDVDVISDLMIHDLDLFLHLVGEPIVEVRANGTAIATSGLDLAQARVETRSGVVGAFTASRLAREASRRWRVFAPGAYWSLDLRERKAARVGWADGLVEAPFVVPTRDPLGEEIASFLAAVRGEGPYRVPGPEAVAALELAEAVRAAIR